MVRIQVKREGNEEQQFLYDCPSTSGINDIAKDVAEICNLQIRIQLLVLALEQRLLSLCSDSKSALPLTRALSEAKAYASKEQVLHDRPLSVHVLRDHIQTIETEAMSNQLPGFSDSSEVQQLVSSSELEFLQEDTTQLWWAGKELTRDKKLCDYVGKNEKTKVNVSPVAYDSDTLILLGGLLTLSKPVDARSYADCDHVVQGSGDKFQ